MNMDIPRKTGAPASPWSPLGGGGAGVGARPGAFSMDRSVERGFLRFTRSLSINDSSSVVSPLKKLSADRGGRNDENNGFQRKRAFSTFGSNDSGVSSPTPGGGVDPYSSSAPRDLFRRSNSISVANPSIIVSGKHRQDSGHGEYFNFSLGQMFGDRQSSQQQLQQSQQLARSPEPKSMAPMVKPKSPTSQMNKDDLVAMICETSLR